MVRKPPYSFKRLVNVYKVRLNVYKIKRWAHPYATGAILSMVGNALMLFTYFDVTYILVEHGGVCGFSVGRTYG